HPRPWHLFRRHAAIVILGVALVLPFALTLLGSTVNGETPGLLQEPDWDLSTMQARTEEGVSIALYVFQPALRAGGFFMHEDGGGESFYPHAVVLSWVQIIGLALGLIFARQRAVLLALVAGTLLIAVGHFLWVGTVVPNPFYVLGVKLLPVLRRLWWPGRAAALGALFLAILAAAGTAGAARWIASRTTSRGTRPSMGRQEWAALALGLGLLGTFGLELRDMGYAPFPTWNSAIPEGYRCLAQGPEGAIIELPYARSQAHLYYQTVHGRPILGGMVEDNPIFTPAEQRSFIRENTFVDLVMTVGSNARVEGFPDEEDRQAVYDMGYRYVVVQHQHYASNAPKSRLIDVTLTEQTRGMTRRLTELLGRPVYTDPDISIYAPWGDESPCGDAGPGRLARDMMESEKRPPSSSEKYLYHTLPLPASAFLPF
ncbi:MAG: hypothetical protein QGG40_20890, partial [Myxococcota bacterium]|nr:hypothetical protein [Myxococcota bacterium]